MALENAAQYGDLLGIGGKVQFPARSRHLPHTVWSGWSVLWASGHVPSIVALRICAVAQRAYGLKGMGVPRPPLRDEDLPWHNDYAS